PAGHGPEPPAMSTPSLSFTASYCFCPTSSVNSNTIPYAIVRSSPEWQSGCVRRPVPHGSLWCKTFTVTEAVQFFFDPMCPYAYQASVWIRDVRAQIGLDITWRFF